MWNFKSIKIGENPLFFLFLFTGPIILTKGMTCITFKIYFWKMPAIWDNLMYRVSQKICPLRFLGHNPRQKSWHKNMLHNFSLCITWISYEMWHNWCHILIFSNMGCVSIVAIDIRIRLIDTFQPQRKNIKTSYMKCH